MRLRILILVLCILVYPSVVSANAERDVLNVFMSALSDPDKVLTSGDADDDDPCALHWVTCNNDSKVTRIDLDDKNISGQLVAQLGSLSNLTYLELQRNNISGKIPPELGNLTNLVSLDLSQNILSGPIPGELGKLSTLTSLELKRNNISGKIPPELGNLTNLVHLDLSQNNLSGPIPDELGKLSTLKSLRLDDNYLSGSIPVSLACLSSLQLLSLANNNLSGYVPINGSFCLFTPESNSLNWNHSTITAETEEGVNYRPIGADVAIAGSIFACITFFIGVFVTVLVWLRRENKNQDRFFDLSAEDDPEIQLGALYWYSPKSLNRYTLTDLQVATDNFNPENIVGRGGFGQVYKGCLADGSLVAIKRLKDVRNKMEELQFQTEVEMISLVVHPNLLRLHGFCMTLSEKLLVYPFMANGSLASCLQGGQGSKPLLDWGKRKQIALGSAKGLAYLHHQFDPKVIHRDVKAANILLNDEFEAVVGDFGLVKLMGFEDSHLITGVCGTIGYIAPEYYSNGTCSEKTDVFGYGVTLLELLSGQKATDLAKIAIEDGGLMLHDWVKGLLKDKNLEKLVDGNLKGDYIQVEVEQLVQVALLSTYKSAMQRPTMYEVVRMLQGDGLAKRWKNQETSYQESDDNPHPNGPWIVDSTSRLRPDILSGPR